MGFLKNIGKALADILAEPKHREYGISQRDEVGKNAYDSEREKKRRKEGERLGSGYVHGG